METKQCLLRGDIKIPKDLLEATHEQVYKVVIDKNSTYHVFFATTSKMFSEERFYAIFFLCETDGTPLVFSKKLTALEVIEMFGLTDNYYVASAVVALLNGGATSGAVSAAEQFLRASHK